MGQLIDAPASSYPLANETQISTPLGTTTFSGVTLAGVPLPGQWLLKKAARDMGVAKRRLNYMNGAILVPTGTLPMDVEYEVRIWESTAYAAFIALCQTLLKAPAVSVAGIPASAALGIDDPVLKIYGVTSVVVAAVQIPLNPLAVSGGRGPWVGSVKFIEYTKAPKPVPPVPQQVIPDPGAVTPAAASANLATVGAAAAAGDAARQAAAASALVPPR